MDPCVLVWNKPIRSFLDVIVYLLMVDIDADVMNMFTQDYGLTAAELTRVIINCDV